MLRELTPSACKHVVASRPVQIPDEAVNVTEVWGIDRYCALLHQAVIPEASVLAHCTAAYAIAYTASLSCHSLTLATYCPVRANLVCFERAKQCRHMGGVVESTGTMRPTPQYQ